MRLRKKIYADLELDKKSVLFEYKQWSDQNEKYSTFNRNLQRQNEKLLKENAILKKQNEELLIYKEKYLRSLNIPKQQDSMRINMDFIRFNSGRKSSLQKNEFVNEKNQKLLYAPRSARNSNEISARIQTRMNQTQQRMSSRKSSAQRSRRRFNYLQEEYNQAGKGVENKGRQFLNGDSINRYFDNCQLKEQQQEIVKKEFQSSKKLFQETQQAINAIEPQQQSLKQKALIEEIQQLKTIQQQLLKRLSQRGALIQQLHSLLIVSQVKQGNPTKENDTETIDTAFSPKYQP